MECLRTWIESDNDNANTCPTCRGLLFGQRAEEEDQLELDADMGWDYGGYGVVEVVDES
ncbi:hypothetical protein BU26DRAFT_520449, partial [Trematosphaeria pertusa]